MILTSKILTNVAFQVSVLIIYGTEFAKKGLIHASNFSTLRLPYVGIFGGGKYWEIWQICGNFPNFYPPNVLVLPSK